MAEIFDVVERLTYEVNDAGLEQASREVNNQIRSLAVLSTRIDSLQKAFDKTSASEIERRQRINSLIVQNKTRLDALTASYSKQFVEQTKAAKGTEQVKRQFDSLNVAVSQIIREVPNAAISIRTFAISITNQFGQLYDSITAKLRQLQAEGQPTSQIFRQIGSSIFSLNTLVSAGIPILIVLAQKLFEAGDEAKDAKKQTDAFAESLKSISNALGSEVANIIELTGRSNNLSLSYTERAKAIEELEQATGLYFTTAEKEKLLAGELVLSYDDLTQAILRTANARLKQAQIEQLAQETAGFQLELGRINRGELIASETRRNFLISTIALNQKRIQQLTQQKNLEEETNAISFGAIDAQTRAEQEAAKKRDKERAKETLFGKEKKKKQKEDIDYIKLFTDQLTTISEEDFNRLREELEALDKARGAGVSADPSATGIIELEKKQALARDKQREEDKKNEEKAQQERLKRLKEYVSAYQQATQTIANLLNSITQAQISRANLEYSIQEQRVRDAERLAERGNVEAVRIERERLNAISEEREKFARRQQAINSILTLSNSILAVATAAGESGAGAIAIVPAVIAAIAAGYGAVTALFRNTELDSFKDGVVGYNGKGTATSDSNTVRISRGESVITASATNKYRDVLEMMNKGYDIPVLKMQQNNSRNDEKWYKRMVNAIEDNRFKQDIFFNEQGVGIMTERAMRNNRRRWR